MNVKRRELLKSLGVITASSAFTATGAATSVPAPQKSSTKRPNILVFLSDDHAQWLQRAYGNSEVHLQRQYGVSTLLEGKRTVWSR